MTDPRWFWGLLATLGLLFLSGAMVSTCLFQRVPQLAEPSKLEVVEEPGILPRVPVESGRDVIGHRAPIYTRWMIEAQGLRSLAIELRETRKSTAQFEAPGSLDHAVQGFLRALPFEVSDPLAWIRSGYDLTEPWAVAWVSEGAEDAGAWVLFLPVRNHDSARKTTRALLWAWDLDERPVAWTWDVDYHQVVIEQDHSRSPAQRIQTLADSSRELPFSATPQMGALNQGLGGEWNFRLRCLNSGREELEDILGSAEGGLEAWPLQARGNDSLLGMTLRLRADHQRIRIGLVGPDLAALRVNAGMSVDPAERKEIASDRIVESLGLSPRWWESLQGGGPAVKRSLERIQVVAELGPSGLVVDLRSSGGIDAWEPLVQWWISLIR